MGRIHGVIYESGCPILLMPEAGEYESLYDQEFTHVASEMERELLSIHGTPPPGWCFSRSVPKLLLPINVEDSVDAYTLRPIELHLSDHGAMYGSRHFMSDDDDIGGSYDEETDIFTEDQIVYNDLIRGLMYKHFPHYAPEFWNRDEIRAIPSKYEMNLRWMIPEGGGTVFLP